MESFGKRLYSSLCHGGAVVSEHRSEGTFGIPRHTAQYIGLLRINSYVNSGALQKSKSLLKLWSPQNRKLSTAPAVENFHCVTHPNLSSTSSRVCCLCGVMGCL